MDLFFIEPRYGPFLFVSFPFSIFNHSSRCGFSLLFPVKISPSPPQQIKARPYSPFLGELPPSLKNPAIFRLKFPPTYGDSFFLALSPPRKSGQNLEGGTSPFLQTLPFLEEADYSSFFLSFEIGSSDFFRKSSLFFFRRGFLQHLPQEISGCVPNQIFFFSHPFLSSPRLLFFPSPRPCSSLPGWPKRRPFFFPLRILFFFSTGKNFLSPPHVFSFIFLEVGRLVITPPGRESTFF